jgi:hypothetical protein
MRLCFNETAHFFDDPSNPQSIVTGFQFLIGALSAFSTRGKSHNRTKLQFWSDMVPFCFEIARGFMVTHRDCPPVFSGSVVLLQQCLGFGKIGDSIEVLPPLGKRLSSKKLTRLLFAFYRETLNPNLLTCLDFLLLTSNLDRRKLALSFSRELHDIVANRPGFSDSATETLFSAVCVDFAKLLPPGIAGDVFYDWTLTVLSRPLRASSPVALNLLHFWASTDSDFRASVFEGYVRFLDTAVCSGDPETLFLVLGDLAWVAPLARLFASDRLRLTAFLLSHECDRALLLKVCASLLDLQPGTSLSVPESSMLPVPKRVPKKVGFCFSVALNKWSLFARMLAE